MSENAAVAAFDSDLEPGEQVGEYRVESRLGQGAFGTVFRAVHPLIGKLVAIKVLAPKFSSDPEVVERFRIEALAVNQIRHRHIIDIFAFGQLPDGRSYYVMEHLDGETLDARLEREGPLAMADALPILRAIGRALDAAHAKNIAHRDLKPENIFLGRDSDGEVFPKLLDFGIAKLLAPEEGLSVKTRTGMSVGTPYFMSPEQCRGHELDHRTDVYSFGVLAYLVLTGAYPFDGDDYVTIMMGQVSGTADPPSVRNPALGSGVDDVIAKLMAKDPADRPHDLKSAVDALEAATGAEDRTSGTHTAAVAKQTNVAAALPAERREVRTARSRGPVVIGLAALVAIVAVIVVVATHGERTSTSTMPPSKLTTTTTTRPTPIVHVVPIVAPVAIDAGEPDAPPPDAAIKKPHHRVDKDLIDPFHP